MYSYRAKKILKGKRSTTEMERKNKLDYVARKRNSNLLFEIWKEMQMENQLTTVWSAVRCESRMYVIAGKMW